MNTIRPLATIFILAFLLFTNLHSADKSAVMDAKPTRSFAELDRRAREGDALSVVFFGGSLTWGANASDPNVTSYRGRMMQHLRDRYPQARWHFHDAAIGGTGSDLGIFRLERDVLAHNPDLVFLDFMANDKYDGTDNERWSCYETLVRTMVQRGIAVQQMYFGFQWQFTDDGYDLNKFHRRTDYMRLSERYGLAEGDIYPLIREASINDKTTLKDLWPLDGIHPCDEGYRYFFEAARQGFETAFKEKRVCRVPEKPVFGIMSNIQRIRLADRNLPEGWNRSQTYRTSLWFDGLSSRWMGDVARFDPHNMGIPVPLELTFTGTFLAFFGEASHEGIDFTVAVDGEPLPFRTPNKDNITDQGKWPFHVTHGQGNLFMWKPHMKMLPEGIHSLTITPIIPKDIKKKSDLRIESVCVATYEPAAAEDQTSH